jgi:hypothetical protein
MPTTHAHPVHSNGKSARTSEIDIALPAMDALSEELNRLAAINAELVGRLRGAAAAAESDAVDPAAATAANEELAGLRQENEDLRRRIEELEQFKESFDNAPDWVDRQKEYEALLEEKSEVIRALHLKLHELQEGARRAAGEPIPKEEELRQLKHELEEQKRQLQEDEESLMSQMRTMELALSKDRAELARQRQEMQRLQSELNREIEQSSRDPALRERLLNLRRAHDPAKKEPPAPVAVEATATKPAPQNSGLFRRLFG